MKSIVGPYISSLVLRYANDELDDSLSCFRFEFDKTKEKRTDELANTMTIIYSLVQTHWKLDHK